MNKSPRIASIMIGLFILILGSMSAWAQDPMPMPGCGMERMRQDKNLENLRMLKLLELLELDDKQSPEFIGVFAAFRKEGKEINQEIQSRIDSLAELLKSGNPSEDEIRARMAKIDDLKSERELKLKEFHNNVSKILTAVQMGRMVVFEERFEGELIGCVRGFREKPAPPLGP